MLPYHPKGDTKMILGDLTAPVRKGDQTYLEEYPVQVILEAGDSCTDSFGREVLRNAYQHVVGGWLGPQRSRSDMAMFYGLD